MRYYGITNPVGTLSDHQSLSSGGDVKSDSMVFVGGPHNGTLWINVYADEDGVTFATSNTASIEFEAFSSDLGGSAQSPLSISNASGLIQGSGTQTDNARIYLMHHLTGDSNLIYAAGDLIAEFGIPETLLKLIGYDWVQLRYANQEDHSSKEVTAFVYIK